MTGVQTCALPIWVRRLAEVVGTEIELRSTFGAVPAGYRPSGAGPTMLTGPAGSDMQQ